MKTKIATVLSIVGVLGAGSAAALVNTQILDNGPSEATASAAVLPPASTVDLSVPDTAPPTTLGDDAVVDSQGGATSSTMPTSSTTPAPALAPALAALQSDSPPMLTAFNVGDSGVVTVDVVSGNLLLVNTQANAGWTVARSVESSSTEVDVDFVSSTVRVTFTAIFADGRITPSVTSAALPAPTAPASPTATTAATPTFNDDHDDDYETDDHEADDSHEREEEHDDD
jgi:hypothetical protein